MTDEDRDFKATGPTVDAGFYTYGTEIRVGIINTLAEVLRMMVMSISIV